MSEARGNPGGLPACLHVAQAWRTCRSSCNRSVLLTCTACCVLVHTRFLASLRTPWHALASVCFALLLRCGLCPLVLRVGRASCQARAMQKDARRTSLPVRRAVFTVGERSNRVVLCCLHFLQTRVSRCVLARKMGTVHCAGVLLHDATRTRCSLAHVAPALVASPHQVLT